MFDTDAALRRTLASLAEEAVTGRAPDTRGKCGRPSADGPYASQRRRTWRAGRSTVPSARMT